MRWDHPLVLWAVPALAALVAWLEWRVPGSHARRLGRTLVRVAVLACAAAAVAGPWTQTRTPRPRRVVLAVDVATREPLAGAVREALPGLETRLRDAAAAVDAHFEVLTFTTRAAARETPPPAGPRSALAAALAGARLCFREGETGGVVVLGDGRASARGAREAVAALRADAIRTTGVALPLDVTPPRPAARIAAMDAPTHARGPFVVRARTEDPAGAGHDVVLRVDGAEVARQRRPDGTAGDVVFAPLELPPGLHELGVTLERDGQAAALARRLVEVEAPPLALGLFADGTGGPWARALAVQGLPLVETSPADLAAALADGRVPDLVVADARSLAALPPTAALRLRDRVGDGLGLVVVAGDEPTAWAGLATGPLAAVLPITPQPEPEPEPPARPPPPQAEPPPPLEKPDEAEGPGLKAERRPEEALPITLLLLVDRSGSMAGPIDKLQMAILGAQRAAEALSPWDRVGVITFASDVQVAIPVRSARNASTLAAWLTGVEPDLAPGTDIAGALRRAHEVMQGERSPIKHVILLTDGRQYPSGPLFGPIVKPMRRAGITITAVGIGRGSHTAQLREIVQWAARGHVRSARTPAEIPRILTRDTQQIAEKRRVDAEAIDARLHDERPREGPTAEPEPPAPTPPPAQPPEPAEPAAAPEPAPEAPPLPVVRVRPHEALAGFDDDAWPAVGMPRRAARRPGGVVLLARQDDAPVLAAGRAGLGRVLVWTVPPSDAGVLAWPALGRLCAQIARSALAPEGAFAWLPQPRIHQTPDGATLAVRWPAGTTSGRVEARWVGPDGEARALGAFTSEAPEAVKALPAAAAGARCRVELVLPGGPALAPQSYLVAAAEAAPDRPADAEALARALDGPLQDPAAFVRDLPALSRPTRRDRWGMFLWLAILLLPLDVFLHRRSAAA